MSNIEVKKSFSNIRDLISTIFVVLLTIIFILTFIFVIYNRVYYKVQAMSINMAQNDINIASEKTNHMLMKGVYVVDCAANSLDILIQQGVSNKQLLEYLIQLTNFSMETIDKNYTSLYGWIRGEYLDGNQRVPPEDYNPKERPWFIQAVEGKGKTKIISPYMDMDTHSIIISMSKVLRDNENIVSLDIALDELTQYAKQFTQNGTDYVYIVDKSGMILSSKDTDDIGKNYLEDKSDESRTMLFEKAFETNEPFGYKINNKEYLIFSNSVAGDLEVIVALNQSEILKRPRSVVFVGTIFIIVMIIILICFIFKMYKSMRQQTLNEKEQVKLMRKHADELKNDNEIISSLAGQFDYVCLINILTNTISNYRVDGIFANFIDKNSKTIEPKEFDRVLKTLIPEENFQYFLKQVDRNYILQYLQQHSEYSCDVDLIYQNKTYLYKFVFSVNIQSYTNVILGIKKYN